MVLFHPAPLLMNTRLTSVALVILISDVVLLLSHSGCMTFIPSLATLVYVFLMLYRISAGGILKILSILTGRP